MRRSSWKKSLLLGLLLLGVALLQSAYVIQTLNDLQRTHQSWDVAKFPIVIEIWEDFTDALPNIEQGSSPKVALKEALARWVRATSLSATLGPDTSISEAGLDDRNIVTTADTVNNRNFIGGALGLSLRFSDTVTGEIVEADMILNPGFQWTTLETNNPNFDNLFDVALHEFGHHWNLDHSISRSSTMFFQTSGFGFGFNPLSMDDLAGVNVTYPLVGLGQVTGSITGTVTRDGVPVFGAFVVAVDEMGIAVANGISLTDGTYRLDFLPPGDYTLYVEPLDAPTTEGSVSGGIFNQDMIEDFLPVFFNGQQAPSVTVSADSTTSGRNFQVTQGNASMDPRFLGDTVNAFSGFSVTTAPARMRQGVNSNIVVAGDGVDTLLNNQGGFLLSDQLTTGPVARDGTLGNGDPYNIYPLNVPLDAARGEYPLLLQNGTQETGVVTVGVEVFSPFRFHQAFAQFVDQGATSGLFLINTDLNGQATGKISPRDKVGARKAVTLGALVPDSNGDLDFNIAPGGALSVETSAGTFDAGSLRVGADRSIGGTVLFESSFGTTGVGPSRPLYSFVAPIEFGDGGAINTGLAFTGLDERSFQVFIRLNDQAGTNRGTTTLSVAGNGQRSELINTLFPSIPANFEGSVVVTANRQIGAAVIALRPGIFTTFPVIQNRIFTRSLFAQFAHVGSLTSKLILINPSPNGSATVTIQVRDQAGNAASVTLNNEVLPTGSKTLVIPPLGSVSLETQSFEGLVGSVEVSTQDLPVGGVVLFNGATQI